MTRIRSTRSITCSIVLDRRAGIERDAGLLAERADRLQRAVDVRPGLDVHGDDVGAGLGEGFEIGIARRDHQVHVERLSGVRAQRLHDVGTDRDVGHEVPVHHVDMDPVGAGGIDRAHLLAEPGEVGGRGSTATISSGRGIRASGSTPSGYHAGGSAATRQRVQAVRQIAPAARRKLPGEAAGQPGPAGVLAPSPANSRVLHWRGSCLKRRRGVRHRPADGCGVGVMSVASIGASTSAYSYLQSLLPCGRQCRGPPIR